MEKKRRHAFRAVVAASLVAGLAGVSFGTGEGTIAYQGPSSSQSPYVLGTVPGAISASILTVGDSVNNNPAGVPYRMVGIPDGLGAYSNGDGTFTVLMNHELTGTNGVPRAHSTTGSGAFVSKWKIRKANGCNALETLHGEDLIQNVSTWNVGSGAYNPPSKGEVFDRFCSGDLPKLSAFKHGNKGYNGRIYLNGEETNEGQAWAHVVTGPNAGTSYELPRLGRMGFENVVANPKTGVKTVVMMMDDSTPGQVYCYVGMKTTTGNPAERAGLNNGSLYGIRVPGILAEVRETGIVSGLPFELADLGNVTGLNQAGLESLSDANSVTEFLRPEDGAWDVENPNDFYFVTTDRYDQVKDGVGTQVGRSRLYRLRFTDRNVPTLGGTIDMLLDGTEAGNMFDNMCLDGKGHVLIQEDVGGQAHNGKIWQYNIANDTLKLIARHDVLRFGDINVAPTAPFNNDEESSGIIDMSSILGKGWFLLDVQAHYSISDPELVQGGQLLAFYNPDSDNNNKSGFGGDACDDCDEDD